MDEEKLQFWWNSKMHCKVSPIQPAGLKNKIKSKFFLRSL